MRLVVNEYLDKINVRIFFENGSGPNNQLGWKKDQKLMAVSMWDKVKF